MKSLKSFFPVYGLLLLPLFVIGFSLWTSPKEKVDLICPYCDLSGKDFSGMDLTNANLHHAILVGANFNGAKLNGVVFAGADLRNATFENARMGSSDKGPTDLSGANLQLANFDKAKLGYSDFQYTDITCANFSNTDISECVFGPRLNFQAKPNCQPSFRNAVMNCDFPTYWEQIDISGATLPTCPSTDSEGNLPDYSNTIHVSSFTGTDNSSCGTGTSPCKTIQYGINQCPGTDCAVLVAWGAYTPTATIQLKNGVSLLGGYYNGSVGTYQSSVTADTSYTVFSGKDLTDSIKIYGFILNGAPADADGESTTIVQLENSTGVTLGFSKMNGSYGAKGKNGIGGTAGNDGPKGVDATSMFGGSQQYNSQCSSGWGGFGADQGTESVSCHFPSTSCSCSPFQFKSGQAGPGSTGVGAAGAPAGTSVCYNCTARDKGKTPANGTNGNDGPCGKGGATSSQFAGAFSGSTWVPSKGNDGNYGGIGGGGGGGGAGGHCGYCACYCDHTDYHLGTPGGGGGAGGCGGSGGLGGQQGGASFGIVLVNSTLTVGDTVSIHGGFGGKGGQGGNGATGGTGGVGGAPYPSNKVCEKGGTGAAGSYGGTGGKGGFSGGGAGGNGGPVIDVALVGNSSLTGSRIDYYPGQTGSIGTGGTGESSCTDGDGKNGIHGLVAHTHQFDNTQL